MEGELLLPLYLYRFIRLDFVTINLVVILDYTIIILGGKSSAPAWAVAFSFGKHGGLNEKGKTE